MAMGVFEATPIVERARRLVHTLEAGDGRAAFSDAGYGEGDHAQGQRLLRNAEAALEEAKRPPNAAQKARQFGRAYRSWLEARGEDLRRDGLKALAPRLTARHAMDLVGRFRRVARGNVAHEELEATAGELKEWLDRWTPIARRVSGERPELAERFGVTPAPPKKQANA
jgi:hypothetical protein